MPTSTISPETSNDRNNVPPSAFSSLALVTPSTHRSNQRLRFASSPINIFLFLLAFRILNAVCIRTFFQPDEYYQSLEPAWAIAFGQASGAWLTWEWKYHLRSAIHPYIFATGYWTADVISKFLQLQPALRAEILIITPKIIQAHIAACGDYYTWKLAERVYGKRSPDAWACLALTACSPWQWFCSTRTLSNCLETTLTVVALDYWPWEWSLQRVDQKSMAHHAGLKWTINQRASAEQWRQAYHFGFWVTTLISSRLRYSLILAAFACILRPTNILVWTLLTFLTVLRITGHRQLGPRNVTKRQSIVPLRILELWKETEKERSLLFKETILCGTGVLLVSIILDWSFYEKLTFPPFKFLYFNIAKSLAVFYGRNDWHYYPSQGYPMLLTTCLPFAAVGTYQALTNASNIGDTMKSEQRLASAMRYQLACISLAVPFILSFIAHKEVRFIYPVLPLLHVLSSPSIVACITPANAAVSSTKRTIPAAASSASSGIREPLRSSQKQYLSRKKFSICQLILLFSVLLLNLLIALFTTQYHQRGVLSVMAFLRHEYERDYLYQSISQPQLSHTNMTMTVGFLMPCHSTPWRSHLVYPNIHAWALGCEPPVHIPRGLLRDEYMDEADRFYADPLKFMQSEVGPYMAERRHNDITTDSTTSHSPATSSESQESQSSQVRIQNLTPWNGGLDLKLWPEYLVFFEASEEAISTFAKPIGFVACWRSWNSWFHDDWRRRGDLFVLRRPRCVARDDVETADGIVAQRKDTWIW